MANIKVSEMTEATMFDDGDYAMIVQANQNKKISKENMIGNIENNIGDLTDLETPDKTNLVNAINSNLPVVLYNNENNTSLDITLNDSAANYSYLEIFIYDGSRQGYTKVDNPNGKTFGCMTIASLQNEIQLRTGTFTISGQNINCLYEHAITLKSATPEMWTNNFYIKKVLGYK